LDRLRGEYKRWVARCLQLDPNTIGIPGEPHGYVSKRESVENQHYGKRSARDYSVDDVIDFDESDFDKILEEHESNVQESLTSTILNTPLLDHSQVLQLGVDQLPQMKKQKLEESEDDFLAPCNLPLLFKTSISNAKEKPTAISHESGGLQLLSEYTSDSE